MTRGGLNVGFRPLPQTTRDGSRTSAGVDEPADQVLVRARLLRFFVEPISELTRRAAREGPEAVQAAQLGKMLVPGLGPDRVVGELVPVQVELASGSQQAARVAEHAQLQREAQLVAGAPPGPDGSAGPRRSGCSAADAAEPPGPRPRARRGSDRRAEPFLAPHSAFPGCLFCSATRLHRLRPPALQTSSSATG